MSDEIGTFSVVTPNYNMGHYLPETIESVLANLQLGDQYFIVDGGSTDGSVKVIKQYEARLSGWISEPDNGYADALVKGFKRCTGEYLCWINSGDLLLRGALQAARQVLTETGADLIFGDDFYIDDESKVILHSTGYVRSLKRIMLFGGWTPLQDACFWRRSLYELVGGINPNLKYAADYDFFLRVSWSGQYLYVPKTFSAFRRHDDQKSTTSSLKYEVERVACRQRMLKQLEIPVLKQFLAEIYYFLLVHWRHHVARRFHRSEIQSGTSVGTLMVQNDIEDTPISQKLD